MSLEAAAEALDKFIKNSEENDKAAPQFKSTKYSDVKRMNHAIVSPSNDCSCANTVKNWEDRNDSFNSYLTISPAQPDFDNARYIFPLDTLSVNGQEHHYTFSTSFKDFDYIYPATTHSVVKHYRTSPGDYSNLKITRVTTTTTLEDFSPLDPSKYKTELCRYYQVHGDCKYGSKCNYAHGLQQLKVSFKHGKYKTRNCQSYHETGFCRYGARCSFIHDPEEGILKCPITEREVLEALHYHPMKEIHHHFATMTWRVLGSRYNPPTELYFFTPPPEPSPECYIAALSEDDTDVSSDETVSSRLKLISDESSTLNQYSNACIVEKIDSKLLVKTDVKSETNLTKEQISNETCEIKITSESCNPIPSTDFFFKSSLNHNESISTTCDETTTKKTQLDQTLPNNFTKASDQVDKKKPTTKNKVYQNAVMKSKNLSYISGSIKSFQLEDLLRCLKTREGQHHLAPWSNEVEEKCSSVSSKTKSTSINPQWNQENKKSCEHLLGGTKDYSKFKTELCRSFQYNQYCEYGDACLYAHGTEDLQSYPKHPMYRTRKCFSFHQRGFCLYGSRCQFLHDID